MPKTTSAGVNYSEEQLAKKRAVVLEFLDKQKKGSVQKKKPAEAKPTVILPAKPQLTKPVSLPKSEKVQVDKPQAPAVKIAPISQFLGAKNQGAASEAVEVDFLEDVKREKQRQVAAPLNAVKKTNDAATKKTDEADALAQKSVPASIIAEPAIKPGSKATPSVNLIAGISGAAKRRTGNYQWTGIAAVIIMLAFSFYSLICLTFFTFKPQSGLFRAIARLVPVPGLISSYGFVEFYQYLDLKQSLLARGTAPGQLVDLATAASVEWQILEQLARYYQLPMADSAPVLLDNLGKAVVSDKEINAIAFSSIRKIKQEIANGKSLDEVAAGHNATVANEYYANDDAQKKFGPSFLSLAEGAMSNIVVSPEGFYIVQKMKATNEAVEVKYVLVKPKTLSDIVDGRLTQAKAINFVQ